MLTRVRCSFEGKRMHSRLSLQELLLSGVPCSSSSFPSSCRSSASGEIGPTETKIVYGSTSIVQCSRVSASAEGGVDVPVNCRKREGKAALITDEAKRRKVFKDSWFLVGRLLLWNRTASSHPTNGSNSMDCLAFCDGVAAVCCTVQTLELDLLGQSIPGPLYQRLGSQLRHRMRRMDLLFLD